MQQTETRYRIWFSGRRIGAIGIFYRLPPVEVTAASRDAAVEAAREISSREYEHLSLASWIAI